jgi:hypothetical protein
VAYAYVAADGNVFEDRSLGIADEMVEALPFEVIGDRVLYQYCFYLPTRSVVRNVMLTVVSSAVESATVFTRGPEAAPVCPVRDDRGDDLGVADFAVYLYAHPSSFMVLVH